jgi:DNA-binding winged helix-turn-helix (wHTH) protein
MKYFSHFRFDRSERKLWLGPDVVALTRKAADLLAVLIQDAGATVSHQKILENVWPGTHVQQDNIKVLVHELRHALGDNPESPRYVQSEAGRGYSFVAAVADAPCPMLEGSGHSHPPSIARDYVMMAIDGALDAALNRREAAHLYFEGIAGSGKTTVCQEIYRRASRWPSVRVAYGRAHRTSTEPFPAIVALLERLVARYPREAAPVVERRAPTWFAHLQNRSTIIDQHPNAENAAKLAFELVDTFVELGQHEPFVLILEDLHWTQTPSLDILSMLAAEAIPSRIVVVATYAPFASLPPEVAGAPVSPAPILRSHLAPVQLLPLSEATVWDYLERRFGALCADALAGPIHGASAGHAASVTRIVDSLAAAGFLRHSISGWNLNVPLKRVHGLIVERVTDAIRAALDGFGPEELRLLQGAACVGWKFDTDSVAQLLGVDHPAALRHGFDVLATHLPIFERTAPAQGRGPILASGFRFIHRQWFDVLRAQSNLTAV